MRERRNVRPMKILYTAQATADGGRVGRTRSSDGRLDLELAPPPELGGPAEGNATNPEQIFAAGYASCFHSALKLIAEHRKVEHAESTVTATVHLGPSGSGGFALSAELDVNLPGVDDEAAEKVVRRAYKHCPYSKATRGNIELTLSVNGTRLEEPAPV